MIFSEKLRRLIEERDITQKQLAADLSISYSTLGGYVQGTSEPDFQTLLMFAEYFHVSTDYLLGHSDYDLTSSQQELIRISNSLSPEQLDVYIEQGKAFLKLNNGQL